MVASERDGPVHACLLLIDAPDVPRVYLCCNRLILQPQSQARNALRQVAICMLMFGNLYSSLDQSTRSTNELLARTARVALTAMPGSSMQRNRWEAHQQGP